MMMVSGSRMSMGSKWPDYRPQMISFGRQARWGTNSGVGVARARILALFHVLRHVGLAPRQSALRRSWPKVQPSNDQQGCKICAGKQGSWRPTKYQVSLMQFPEPPVEISTHLSS